MTRYLAASNSCWMAVRNDASSSATMNDAGQMALLGRKCLLASCCYFQRFLTQHHCRSATLGGNERWHLAKRKLNLRRRLSLLVEVSPFCGKCFASATLKCRTIRGGCGFQCPDAPPRLQCRDQSNSNDSLPLPLLIWTANMVGEDVDHRRFLIRIPPSWDGAKSCVNSSRRDPDYRKDEAHYLSKVASIT